MNKLDHVSSDGHQMPLAGVTRTGISCLMPGGRAGDWGMLYSEVQCMDNVDRMMDRHDRKHYLLATSLACNNKTRKHPILDANRPFANRICFIMNKFEHIRGEGEVPYLEVLYQCGGPCKVRSNAPRVMVTCDPFFSGR